MKFRLDPLSVSGASAIPPIAPVITGVSASGGASPLTTKGDIYTYSTTNDRLPVGGDGTVLSSDSTQATGLKWISSGGTGTVTTVSVVTANGVSGSVANATTTPAITLTLGAITPTTVNGLTITTTTGTLTVASAKTLTISNSLTLAGTDLTTMTFPGTSDTVVTLGATQALTHKDLTDATNTFPTFNQNTTGSAAKWTTARSLAGNSVDGSANVAFANKFVVQGTTDAGLTNAQFMGALGTGIIKNTTTTGVFSVATAPDFPTLNQNTSGTAAGLSAVLVPASGGTGIANNNASTLTISGNFATTLTVSATTTLTLPTTGTLATLAGVETLTNKTLSDTFMGTTFDSQSATFRNVLLNASVDYLAFQSLEVGAAFNLEVPANSSLEIIPFLNTQSFTSAQHDHASAAGGGTLNAANALQAASIVASKLGIDSSWAWQTWTPTWTHFTPGNGTVVAKYTQLGKTIFCFLKFVFGSTSSIGPVDVLFTLPVTATGDYIPFNAVGTCGMATSTTGSGTVNGTVAINSTATAALNSMSVSGANVVLSGISATAPFTWATGYELTCNFMYQAA